MYGTIAGAVIVIGSMIGANAEEPPEQVTINYPAPDPIEEEIAKMQLDIARKMKAQVDDPRIMQDIYKLLPEANMSPDDRTKFANEYTEIKKEVIATGMEQTNQAFGEKLDDLVSRGVMSQEQADRQRVKNESAINAITSIIGNRLDASQISAARNYFFKKGATNLLSASAIATVDQRARDIFTSAVKGGLSYYLQKAQNVTDFQIKEMMANTQFSIDIKSAYNEFQRGALIGMGTNTMQGYQASQDRALVDAYLSSGNQTGGMGSYMDYGSYDTSAAVADYYGGQYGTYAGMGTSAGWY